MLKETHTHTHTHTLVSVPDQASPELRISKKKKKTLYYPTDAQIYNSQIQLELL